MKQVFSTVLQLHFEVETFCNVVNEHEISACEEPINLNEKDGLFQFLHIQLQDFFKDMLSGNNRKIQDNFLDNESKPVCWMNLKGTKRDTSAEKGRKEFMESAKLSYAQLEDKKNVHVSLPFLLLAIHAFNVGVVKDCRLVHASEGSNFSAHTGTT